MLHEGNPLDRLARETEARLAVRAEPARAEPIVFGAPLVGEEEIQEVVRTLRSGWLGTGPKTHQFEFQFADYVGARFAVATNSGTAALHLALLALGIGPGDEVITTPLTFAATANVIEHCGAKPVFADVREHDGNIDPAEVARRVGPRTRAVIAVHYAGATADMRDLRSSARDLPIVVDAAHAVEATYESGAHSAGEGATATAYSFYVTKNVVTGEGGMLVTDDDRIAETSRVRGLHGLDNDAWKRYTTNNGAGVYDLVCPGHKYNMTDIQASLGIHQLARVERTLARRTEVWQRYNEAFADLPHVTVPARALLPDDCGRHARHLYTLWMDWGALGLDRGELIAEMRSAGIGLGWHFPALHLQRYYAQKYGYGGGELPVTERIAERTVSLPMSAALSDHDVDRVIEAISEVVRQRV